MDTLNCELIERGDDVSYQDVLTNVQTRDHIDSTREDSPLTMAEDAINIEQKDVIKLILGELI